MRAALRLPTPVTLLRERSSPEAMGVEKGLSWQRGDEGEGCARADAGYGDEHLKEGEVGGGGEPVERGLLVLEHGGGCEAAFRGRRGLLIRLLRQGRGRGG